MRLCTFVALGLLFSTQPLIADEGKGREKVLAEAELRVKSIYEKRDFAPACRLPRASSIGSSNSASDSTTWPTPQSRSTVCAKAKAPRLSHRPHRGQLQIL